MNSRKLFSKTSPSPLLTTYLSLSHWLLASSLGFPGAGEQMGREEVSPTLFFSSFYLLMWVTAHPAVFPTTTAITSKHTYICFQPPPLLRITFSILQLPRGHFPYLATCILKSNLPLYSFPTTVFHTQTLLNQLFP